MYFIKVYAWKVSESMHPAKKDTSQKGRNNQEDDQRLYLSNFHMKIIFMYYLVINIKKRQ